MVQEYLAFSIFGLAILFTLTSLVRFVVGFKKNYQSGCGSNCNCQEKKNPALSAERVNFKNVRHKHVRLK